MWVELGYEWTNNMSKNRQKTITIRGITIESENRMRVAEMESGTEMGRDRQHKDQMRGTQTDEDGMGWDGSGKAVQVEYVCVCAACARRLLQHPSIPALPVSRVKFFRRPRSKRAKGKRCIGG